MHKFREGRTTASVYVIDSMTITVPYHNGMTAVEVPTYGVSMLRESQFEAGVRLPLSAQLLLTLGRFADASLT